MFWKKKKEEAFTLIELLVVIVIIGVLATVSVGTFSAYKNKAFVSQYRIERVQASKERYKECLEVRTQHCGPSFVLYVNIDDNNLLYKKDLNSPPEDPGVAVTDFSVSLLPAITVDGKSFVYTNDTDNNYLYIREIDGNVSSPGTVLVEAAGGNHSMTYDGEHIVYEHFDSLAVYIKSLSTASSDIGVPITSVGFDPIVTPDGLSIIYRNFDNGAGGALYKKSTGSSLSDLGISLTVDNGFSPFITIDNEYVIYTNFSQGWQLYKKDISQGNGHGSGNRITSNGGIYPSVTSDGNFVVYQNSNDGSRLYKKSLTDQTLGAGDLLTTNQANYPIIYP